MSCWELKSLTAEGRVVTRSQLRSGKHEQPEMSQSETDTHDANASEALIVQELRKDMTIVAEELEVVRTEFTILLQQTMEMAEYAKKKKKKKKSVRSKDE